MKSIVFTAIVLISAASVPAIGAQFCVHTSAELTAALATASTNGEDDNIKLAPGIYTPGSGGFQFHSSDLHGLSMGGGFDTPLGGVPCSLPLGGAQWSVLDGAGSNRLLEVVVFGTSAAPVFLHDLTLRNGSSVAGDSPVLVTGSTEWNGNVVVDNISVRDNHTTFVVAALAANGTILVRSSEYVGNTSTAINGIVLSLISNRPGNGVSVIFNNNTVAGNSVPATSQRGGAAFSGTTPGEMHVANNILWNNGGVDISLITSAIVYLDHDDIGSRSLGGSVVVNETNSYQVDPQFVSPADARLASASPLRDAGIASPIGGAGSADVGGDPRVVFGGIDLGAREIQDSIFKDGFE
ncbi:MAG: hypothetical protein ABIW82_09740 [Dokdonella sp.]